jgi:hypothetical protein
VTARALAVAASGELRPGEPPDRAGAELRPGEPAACIGVAGTVAPGNGRPSAAPPRDTTQHLDSTSARLHVTVSRRFLEKLAAARDALSHSHPGAGTEEILEAGLDLLLERRAKRNGIVAMLRKTPPPAKTDLVPAHVKRAVWKRADGRCELRLHSGERCGSTTRLEYDHVVPRAHGGPSTIDNVRLACREHNLLAARRVFGDAWMDRFQRRAATPSAGGP